jgi:hypothetical protein
MSSGARLPSVGEVRARHCRAAAAAALAAAFSLGAVRAAQAELVFPAEIEDGARVPVVWRLAEPMSGTGALLVSWTDADGRIVETLSLPVALDRARAIPFALDTRRAVAALNFLEVRLTLPGGSVAEKASFIVSPPEPLWRDFHVIMWQPQSVPAYLLLKGLGVDAGMVHADRAAPGRLVADEADPLLAAGERWYVENIATDFYSAYHRFFPGRPVNWRFTELQARYRADPHDPASFVRDPSLSDPAWLGRIRARLAATVALHRRYRPLYYNLADETGIADLAAFWDFDFGQDSLAGFRRWLARQYPSLAALDREWGAHFARWQDVAPATTEAAMQRGDENFAAWADMKAWMDAAFAHALAAGRDAVHAADPHAYAAIEGAQAPGWGGYDYSRLTRAVDVMEIYDVGDNVAIAHSLAPALPLLTTSFGAGPAEESRIWREVLGGVRGVVLWDEKGEFVQADGSPGPRAEQATYFHALRGGVGALLAASAPHWNEIAILYSPASMRTQWMLDWRTKGDAWIERGSEAEGADNTVRAATHAFLANFQHLGFAPRFVTPADIEEGKLAVRRDRLLILPHAIALSAATARAIRRFVAGGGIVMADTEPGLFDEHGRRLAQGSLADLLHGQRRVVSFTPRLADESSLAALRTVLANAGLRPAIGLATVDGAPAGDVVLHRFDDGAVTILGIARDYAEGAAAGPIVLTLPHSSYAYDLLSQRPLGRGARFEITLDPVRPALIALADAPLAPPAIAGPARARRGATLSFRLAAAGPRTTHVFHVAVTDPGGKPRLDYTKNIAAPGGAARFTLPLAENDPAGTWRLEISDAASGATVERVFDVVP